MRRVGEKPTNIQLPGSLWTFLADQILRGTKRVASGSFNSLVPCSVLEKSTAASIIFSLLLFFPSSFKFTARRERQSFILFVSTTKMKRAQLSVFDCIFVCAGDDSVALCLQIQLGAYRGGYFAVDAEKEDNNQLDSNENRLRLAAQSPSNGNKGKQNLTRK